MVIVVTGFAIFNLCIATQWPLYGSKPDIDKRQKSESRAESAYIKPNRFAHRADGRHCLLRGSDVGLTAIIVNSQALDFFVLRETVRQRPLRFVESERSHRPLCGPDDCFL